ncbi:MAG: protein adenylyltransferase SelO family protein [bacterium]|nr:protein adenylyltransferase SelO family protein [bacterium]
MSGHPRKRPGSPTNARARKQAGKRPGRPRTADYTRLASIDGRHPLARTAPSAVVPYPARRRRDSQVVYFNFALAREIGLLPAGHADRLTAPLRDALLDTFSLQIVNEWDEAHGRFTKPGDRLPHTYMATRYLQLQHPDKRGQNSGDGRSIWNGSFRGPKGSFDVSSCGTGVTRLCPATSEYGRFFRTGNVITDYGCGTAHVDEGIGAALMSEAFHRNGVRTERVLAVLALPSGFAINVRIAPNLLRPSHFFGLLRRGEHEDLRHLVDYYAEREIRDGRWPKLRSAPARYRHLAERVATDFARTVATFESEYIFCWLDWDGDNVLTDGSILDYGSVRQFGLYHHSYRFKDTDRYSTSIPEQRRKARQIVQRFAQIRDLLLNGRAPSLEDLKEDPVLERFDREFESERRRLFLRQIGLDARDARALERARPEALERLLTLHHRLERRRSSRGEHAVPDGLSWNAIYCMRDVLRELPALLLARESEDDPRVSPRAFYDLALSDYASRTDRRLTDHRRRVARDYQRAYLDLIDALARRQRRSRRSTLAGLAPAARDRNPYARMTGDGLTHATRRLSRNRRRLRPEESHRLIQAFADFQQRDDPPTPDLSNERPLVQRILRDLLAITRDFRESL